MNLSENNLPTNKKFGIFFSIIFFFLSIYTYVNWDVIFSILFIILSIFFLLASIIKPSILKPANVSWMYLGFVLSKIVNPIILGIIFFILFTPIGIIRRTFGTDTLEMKKLKKNSYWSNYKSKKMDHIFFKKQF